MATETKKVTNIEKLDDLGILGDVRQRLGADDENDTQFDDRINGMPNKKLIALHCGWVLGDESWWNDFKYKFDELKRIDKEGI